MSYLFNGTTSNLQLSSALVSAMPLTFTGWFNPTTTTTTETILAITKNSGVGGSDYYKCLAAGVVANDPIRTIRGNVGTTSAADTTGTVGFIAQKWNHACSVFTSATLQTSYLQGGRVGTDTTSITPANLDQTNVGANKDGGALNQFFAGLLAELAIYNCALSFDDQLRLASGALPTDIRPQNLVLYLPLRTDTFDRSPFKYTFANTACVLNSDHPPMLYAAPRRRRAPAIAGGSFNPGWASGATKTVGAIF